MPSTECLTMVPPTGDETASSGQNDGRSELAGGMGRSGRQDEAAAAAAAVAMLAP
jgi:hypothetical protein